MIVYVDVDDTLVRSTGTTRIPMTSVIEHVRQLKADGATLYLWSAGGADYCRTTAIELGIEYLTIFSFSSENWSRPAAEVAALMDLFCEALDRELPALQANGAQLRFIGELEHLESRLRERIALASAATAGNRRLQLQVALSYGGRQDILSAARQLAARCERGELSSRALSEADFAGGLALAGLPDPDLFIRTGGEQRVSNFLLWNLAYAELYFTDTLWPDFSVADFELALQHYAGRQRRFGKTGAQVAL